MIFLLDQLILYQLESCKQELFTFVKNALMMFLGLCDHLIQWAVHRLIVEAYNHNGGLELDKALLSTKPPPPDQPENAAIPWWICGKCHTMSTDAEKCYRQKRCITLEPSFHSLVLDMEVLTVVIVHRSDILLGCQFTHPKAATKLP